MITLADEEDHEVGNEGPTLLDADESSAVVEELVGPTACEKSLQDWLAEMAVVDDELVE